MAEKSITTPTAPPEGHHVHLIGLLGKAGSGKSTVAKLLSNALGKEWTIHAFATRLKRVVETLFGMSPQSLSSDQCKKTASPLGPTYGRMLQLIGGGLRKEVSESIWVDLLFDGYTSGGRWIIEDVRMKNEAARIRALGGKLIRVVREGHSIADGRNTKDISETEGDSISTDATIYNIGSLDQLRKSVEGVVVLL